MNSKRKLTFFYNFILKKFKILTDIETYKRFLQLKYQSLLKPKTYYDWVFGFSFLKTFIFFLVGLPIIIHFFLSVSGYDDSKTLGTNATLISLSSIVQFFLTLNILLVALKGLKNKRLNSCLMYSIALQVAFVYSLVLVITRQNNNSARSMPGQLFFTESVAGAILVNLGECIEDLTVSLSSNAINDVFKFVSGKFLVEKNATWVPQEINNVKLNDRVKFNKSDVIPFRLRLISKDAEISDSMVFGENTPINKKKRSIIHSGSVVISNTLIGEVIAEYKDSMVKKIYDSTISLEKEKPGFIRIVDKIAPTFIIITILISLITFFVWGFALGDIQRGAVQAVGVLIVACPCSFGFTLPLILWMTLRKVARKGTLIKNSQSIEKLFKINAFVFDKTGTITSENPVVKDFKMDKEFEKAIYVMANSFKHPYNKAIIAYLENRHDDFNSNMEIENFNFVHHTGMGFEFHKNGKKYYFGSPKYLISKVDSSFDLKHFFRMNRTDGCSDNFLFDSKKALGKVSFRTEVPSYAVKIFEYLEKKYPIYILSGDNRSSCYSAARKINVPLSNVFFEQTPLQKLDVITNLNKSYKNLTYVGDGFNDILAVQKCQTAITFIDSNKVIIDSSDVVLSENRLSSLKYVLQSISQAKLFIFLVISFATLYNIIAIVLSFTGVVPGQYSALLLVFSDISLLMFIIAYRLKK